MFMKDFIDILTSRKSVRSFQRKPVPRRVITNIIRMATWAPTNCNQQLWNFVVVEDRKTKEQLVSKAASNTIFRRVPVIIFITYDGWNYKEALQAASLALGNLLLAATYSGVSATPINSYGADTKVKKILNIPSRETVCCSVIVGYPDQRSQNTPPVPRRPVEEVIHWERFRKRERPPFTYAPKDWSLKHLQNHQKYYCRKTVPGKQMDIVSPFERTLVHDTLKKLSGPFVDLCSYDGTYLHEFPRSKITAIDLTAETSVYSKAAVTSREVPNPEKFSYSIYNPSEKKFSSGPRVRTITMLFKLERLPDNLSKTMLAQAFASLPKGGTLIIIARKTHILLWFFLRTLRVLFGPDIRKTGLYTFFGPYSPIYVSRTIRLLQTTGFREVAWNGYFPFPPFYEEVYQMFRQYLASGGSSYLHRDKRVDVISKTLAVVAKLQGFRQVGMLGSVAVIRCTK